MALSDCMSFQKGYTVSANNIWPFVHHTFPHIPYKLHTSRYHKALEGLIDSLVRIFDYTQLY